VAPDFDPALGASYRLLKPIGHGATGDVWQALDTTADRLVAAKLLRPELAEDQAVVTGFLAERAILTGLRDPGIVAVFDLVAERGRLALIMEHIDGGALRALLRERGTLEPAIAAQLAALVLDALAVAHQQHIIHRDVKPDNVLLTSGWNGLAPGDVKLSDFGIARLIDGRTRTTGTRVGTTEYMAPEFIEAGRCDWPADVYGAGVTLYELLAGRTPFAGPGPDVAIAQRHLTAAPPPLDLPDPLWRTVAALLDKAPGRRPTAAEAAAQLRGQLGLLAGLPALPPAATPEDFAQLTHQATRLRGLDPVPAELDGAETPSGAAAPAADLPDLGPADQRTRVWTGRPTDSPPAPPPTPAPAPAEPWWRVAPWWKNWRLLAAAGGAAVVIAAIVVFLVTRPASAPAPAPSSSAPCTATQQDQATPTGLTISRSAVCQASGQVELTITYTAQNAPLAGPFLEILPPLAAATTAPPAASDTCPVVSWAGGQTDKNLPTVTGISAACGWSVVPSPIPAQGRQTVKATISLDLPADSAQDALQQWLDDAAATTTATAVADPAVHSTAYAVQRLKSVNVVTAAQIVTNDTLSIQLTPVWPSGQDSLNPLLVSPRIGPDTAILVAVAGGAGGVKFSDTCDGALSHPDATTVVALTQTAACQIHAQVGNFPDLVSGTFAVVNR
jgi:serine/threonine-protein kinase